MGKKSLCSTVQVMLPEVGRIIAEWQKQKMFLTFCELHKRSSKFPAFTQIGKEKTEPKPL